MNSNLNLVAWLERIARRIYGPDARLTTVTFTVERPGA